LPDLQLEKRRFCGTYWRNLYELEVQNIPNINAQQPTHQPQTNIIKDKKEDIPLRNNP